MKLNFDQITKKMKDFVHKIEKFCFNQNSNIKNIADKLKRKQKKIIYMLQM